MNIVYFISILYLIIFLELFMLVNSTQDPEFKKKCNRYAEQYITNCRKYDIPIDASVVISLKTGWRILHPTKQFTEGSLLALMNVLEENNFITKLNLSSAAMQDARFRSAGNGNSNARILKCILQNNTVIQEVDLSYNGLDDDGIREICDAIKENSSITSLNLSSNNFGVVGSAYLMEAVMKNTSLKYLDLSRNALGFHSINGLVGCCAPKNMVMLTNGNFVFEEILNSVSHGVAFLAAVVGSHVLISAAVDTYRTDFHFWASVLYCMSLLFLFLSSCLYHSFFMLPQTSKILQILDHVGIYLLIAGSYTPFLLIALHHHTSAQVVLTSEWIAALGGIIFATCSDLNEPMTTYAELTMFLIMGLLVVLIWPIIMETLSSECLFLLLLGGGFYVSGIIFFILGEIKPIYHVVWHVFVVCGATIHWFDIYFFIIDTDLTSPTKTAMKAAANAAVSALSAATQQ